jgi:hypothetical protein
MMLVKFCVGFSTSGMQQGWKRMIVLGHALNYACL